MKKFLSLLLAVAVALTARAQSTVTVPWRNVGKTGSSLADLTTRSASDLTSGTLAAARLPSYLQSSTLDARRNALATAQALSFDGAAGCTIANTQVFGTGDFSWVAALSVASFADSNFILAGDTNAHVALISTSGSVIVGQRYGADLTGSGAGTIALNTPVVLGYTRSGTTGKYYLNGALVATITDTLNYSGATTAFGKQFGGSQYFNGTLRLIGIDTRALSAAEVLSVYQTGSFPASDFPAAIAGTVLNSGAFANYNYSTFSGASASGFTAASAGVEAAKSSMAFTVKVGDKIRVAVALTLTSGQAPFVSLSNPGVGGYSASVQLSPGANVIDLVATSAASAAYVVFSNTAAASYAVASITAKPLGLIVAPDPNAPGNGLVQLDTSGNGAHLVRPATSTSWAVPGNGPNQVRGTTSTSGNQQLLGTYTLDANTRVTAIYARSRSGTPTVKYGTASGGAQLGAATAISTAWTAIPLGATTVTSAVSSIWVNSTTTDVVETNFLTVPLSF